MMKLNLFAIGFAQPCGIPEGRASTRRPHRPNRFRVVSDTQHDENSFSLVHPVLAWLQKELKGK